MDHAEPLVIVPASPPAFQVASGSSLVLADCPTGEDADEVAPLHVHHNDDEAWHVVSGALRFRFSDRELIAEAGSTVLVPAGVPHTFGNAGRGPSRFIIVLPSRLDELIGKLGHVDPSEHPALYRQYDSELLE